MSPGTGALSFLLGFLLLDSPYSLNSKVFKKIYMAVSAFLILYSLLLIAEYFIPFRLTPELYLWHVSEAMGRFPSSQSSPVSGLFFFLGGIAVIVYLFGSEHKGMMNLVAGIGMLILYAAFCFLAGYLFGVPFLYNSDVVPLSLPTSISIFFLGCGLLAMGGPETILLRQFSGNSGGARILRVLLPVIGIIMIVDEGLDSIIKDLPAIQFIFTTTALAILLIPLTIVVIVRVVKTVFIEAEKAEESRREAEAVLQESEEKFRKLTQSAADAIISIDPQGLVLFFNHAAEKIFGYTEQEALGKSVDILIPGEHEKPHTSSIRRYMQTGESKLIGATRELEARRKDGEIFPIEISLSEVKVNKVPNFIGIIRDISERKAAEVSLAESARKLHELNDTKDKFFSIIAHDLRSPFNAILGLTNMLVNEHSRHDEEEIGKIIGAIKTSSERAYELTENLLLWANSQTGKITFHSAEFNIKKTIDQTIGLAAMHASMKQIRIISVVAEDYIISGDQQMVHTIMRNLLSNAIKFTPAGGVISVSASIRGNLCEISVRDTGVGIPAGYISKLFKIDSNYSTHGTSDEKGSGLGLILCHEFIERHGGKIWVESREGIGSAFFFTLPQNN